MKTSRIVSTGFAMFAMLFGAGNVIFPLALGRDIGSQLWMGLLGFCLTAVIVPLLGLVSVMLVEGDYRQFLGRLGSIPAQLIILLCMILIGPFAIVPRCVVIAHAAVKLYVPSFHLVIFSVLTAALIYLCTIKRGAVVDLLGKYLGPLKFGLLFAIVLVGIFSPAPFVESGLDALQGFARGLNEGYGTCDLLGTIFFSGLILAGLRRGLRTDEQLAPKELAMLGLKAGAIGAVLLGVVYAGFCVVAAFYGQQLVGVADGDIFAVLTVLVLGAKGGFIANMTVALSCLTTAMALSVVFANYLQKELLRDRIAYPWALLVTVGITAVMANLGFSGIMGFLIPIITLIYPALIVLAIANVVDRLFHINVIKVAVLLTFAVSVAMRYLL